MAESLKISSQVLEQLNYIHISQVLSGADLTFFESKITEWSKLPVELHVMDCKGLTTANERFFQAVKTFSSKLKPGQLISLNLPESLQTEIHRLKLEGLFNARKISDLDKKKSIAPGDLKRLLIRYLIRGAYSAVEVALNSTVSCDENYLAKIEAVPFKDFDLISVLDVNNEFLKAEFRLCASTEVLRHLAQRMLGPKAKIDPEMVESMALELLNLIYGHAKSNLNDQESFQLPSAIPRLLRKEQFSQIRRSQSALELSILPLVTPMGSFYVEVDFATLTSPKS